MTANRMGEKRGLKAYQGLGSVCLYPRRQGKSFQMAIGWMEQAAPALRGHDVLFITMTDRLQSRQAGNGDLGSDR